MNDVRVAVPVRANLRAGRHASYGFCIEADLGHKPMRYLFGRRFTGGGGEGVAQTALFVMEPEVLSGTYVWITEDPFERTCQVQTYLPTMKKPIQVLERLVFDCLPLTDVGYIDLMAWAHPALEPIDPDGERGLVPIRPRRTELKRYEGPATVPGLHITESVTVGDGIVVSRLVHRGARQIRRWEVVEFGDAAEDRLPKRIKVSRPDSGHQSGFVRSTEAVPIPPTAFDGSPEQLREVMERRLGTRRG
ncbi:hypothetical protein EDD27_2137 [Nonomuraea polychroma]|uniref:Uncharacterized protein n=1 Tax=Nonomuraea polychroma TaxID=46176 RepID=A0A438M1R4_9ACTN|nr:hypothetical protein [Nonomuraea polychroma]RVX39764.1 hypothetical protein EDD27_2137 [Nonomuraea polychroma]